MKSNRYKNDTLIEANDRIEMSSKDNTYLLKIACCDEKNDKGLYRLELKNDFGVSDTKSNVTILSKNFNQIILFYKIYHSKDFKCIVF